MSWQLFHTECSALTGMTHVSREQFSQTIATAYHGSVMRHLDSVTGGGVVINTAPKLPMLTMGLISIANMNLASHSQSINWVQQVGKFIKLYWVGAMITGPTGMVVVSSTGVWTAPSVVPNTDFNILLWTFEAVALIHLMTLVGTYTSTVVPGLTTPWSGATLLTIP